MKITSPLRLGIKTFLSYFASSIIAVIVVLVFLSMSQALWLKIIGQLLGIAIVASTTYSCIWREGVSDFNRVKFGHMKYDRYKGLKAGLIAAVPQFVFWIALIVFKLFDVNFALIYKIFNFYLMSFLEWVYGNNGTVISELSMGGILLSGIPILIIPVAGFIAYIAGYRQFSLSEHLIYRNLKKKNSPKSKG